MSSAAAFEVVRQQGKMVALWMNCSGCFRIIGICEKICVMIGLQAWTVSFVKMMRMAMEVEVEGRPVMHLLSNENK